MYISWIHHEKSYIIEQSPIMAAMMESSERTQAELERKEKEAARLLNPRKSQQKVRMQTPGSFSRPQQRLSPCSNIRFAKLSSFRFLIYSL